MRRWQWLAAMAFLGALLWMSCWSSAVWAQQPRLEYPLPGPGSCVPNVMHFGYFETDWRRWPCQMRLEEINPAALGREVLPPTEGQPIVPAPKAVTPPQTPTQPQPQGQPQPQVQPQPQPQPQPPAKPEESVLPPGTGGIIRQPGTVLPSTPEGSENKPGSAKPTIEGELPGLGPEPEPTKPSTPPPPAKSPAQPAPTTPPAKTPDAPPAKTPDAPPAKTPDVPPAKPPADKPQKSAMQEYGPILGGWSDASALRRAQAEGIRTDRPELRQIDDQPEVRGGAVKTGAVAAPAHSMEPQADASPARGYRADTIGVTADSPTAYAAAESPAQPAAVSHAALPSVAFGGYCPVELSQHRRWVLGDLRWTVVYRGWIYRLSGADQRREFLADPDRFTPADSGNDAVLSATENRRVPGQIAYCAIYNNRLYMFSSKATQAEFNRSPQRYAVER